MGKRAANLVVALKTKGRQRLVDKVMVLKVMEVLLVPVFLKRVETCAMLL
jgi:hypothetical protein